MLLINLLVLLLAYTANGQDENLYQDSNSTSGDNPHANAYRTFILTVSLTIVAVGIILLAVIILSAVAIYCCIKSKFNHLAMEQQKDRERARMSRDSNIGFRQNPQVIPSTKHNYENELTESQRDQSYDRGLSRTFESSEPTGDNSNNYATITDDSAFNSPSLNSPTSPVVFTNPRSPEDVSRFSGYEIDPFLAHTQNPESAVVSEDPTPIPTFYEPAAVTADLLMQLVNLKIPLISQSEIEIVDAIGSGQFGTVYKGIWKHSDLGSEVRTQVAIKTLTSGTSEEDKIKFLQEAVIMGQFSCLQILTIQGIMMDNSELSIVTHLMPNGDLRMHLISLRTSNMDKRELTALLMSFSRQVILGMMHLYIKCYVHRDLAARNILVTDDGLTCKIADFGLSRDLRNDSYYLSNGGKVPVKWTAPEAINFRRYSRASDIWSYGCVLYEIWSMGEKPFSSYSNVEAIQTIATGYRLPSPPGTVRAMYELMINCWHPKPEGRPLPCTIATFLQKPEYTILKWTPQELALYSEESRTLGSSLSSGEALHKDLQRRYLSVPEEIRPPTKSVNAPGQDNLYETPVTVTA